MGLHGKRWLEYFRADVRFLKFLNDTCIFNELANKGPYFIFRDSTDHVSPIKARKIPKRPRGVKPSDRMERKDWRQELVADAFLAHTACDMRGPTHELVLCRKDQVEILSRYYRNRGEIYLHKKLPQEARLPKNDSIAPHFMTGK